MAFPDPAGPPLDPDRPPGSYRPGIFQRVVGSLAGGVARDVTSLPSQAFSMLDPRHPANLFNWAGLLTPGGRYTMSRGDYEGLNQGMHAATIPEHLPGEGAFLGRYLREGALTARTPGQIVNSLYAARAAAKPFKPGSSKDAYQRGMTASAAQAANVGDWNAAAQHVNRMAGHKLFQGDAAQAHLWDAIRLITNQIGAQQPRNAFAEQSPVELRGAVRSALLRHFAQHGGP